MTVLVKHGSTYLHVLTAPLSVVQCKKHLEIDETSLPMIIEDEDFLAPRAYTTTFETRKSPTIELRKKVVFKFKKTQDTQEQTLDERCLAVSVDRLQIRCQADDSALIESSSLVKLFLIGEK